MNTENSIEPLIQSYAVDFASTNNFLFVKGIQGDGHSTRYVDITLLNESQPYLINPDAVEIVIRGTKPDTKVIFNECEILDANTIRVEITQQMSAIAGRSEYEISVIAKRENRALTSFPFFIVISKSAFDVGYVVSSDEFGLLVQKLNEVNKLNTDVSELIQETLSVIEESRTQTNECEAATNEAVDATDKLKAFHKDAQAAETTRRENEEKRQSDTAAAISNAEQATQNAISQTDTMKALEQEIEDAEAIRINAENERVLQAIDFANEEEKRRSNEVIRIENENERISAENIRISNEELRQAQEAKRETDFQNAINDSADATNRANTSASYAQSVGDDLTNRLNRGEFKGEKGDDGVIHTVSGQYAFQIINGDLYMFYTEGDEPLDLEMDENGDLILTI